MSKSILYIINYHVESRKDSVEKNIIANLADSIEYKVITPADFETANPTIAAVKNQCLREAVANGYRFVHILEDDMVVKNPGVFSKMESVLDLLKIGIICNSTSSRQNTAFGIHTPRLIAENINHPKVKELVWNSYDSKEYICVDIENTDPNFLYFDETLNYYYLVKNLWQRNHGDKSVPFLNFYPTIKDEAEYLYHSDEINTHVTPEIMQKAKAEMETTRIKWEPDQSIDAVMEFIVRNLDRNAE